jgi:hypothetical protein
LLLSFGNSQWVCAQAGFRLPDGKKKDRIQFEFINNLVVIPVEVNGKKLSFLLDTGVNNTLLFSLYENDSLEIQNVTPVKIKGLGEGGDIDALKSVHNQIKIGNAVDKNHTLYVIFDERINFSPRMGIPVHGVIGYDLYKDFVIKTDYNGENITLFDPVSYKERRCRSCSTFELLMRRRKPYVKYTVGSNGRKKDVNLLVDTGASDALWLFDESYGIREDPKNYFEDFLGLGLSGGVFGKRSKLDQLILGDFELQNVNVSYPDSVALRNLNKNSFRNGTVGSDILRRFTVVMDYRNGKMTLRKNRFFSEPFHYNMSGLTIEHDGLVPASEKNEGTGTSLSFKDGNSSSTSSSVSFNLDPVFSFFLAPKYVIAEVRQDSPAAMAGLLKGDEVLSINGKASYRYELSDLTALFSSKSGRRITVVVNRDGSILKKKFLLEEQI